MQPLFPSLDSHFSQVRISTLLFLFSSCCIPSLGRRAYCREIYMTKVKTPPKHSPRQERVDSRVLFLFDICTLPTGKGQCLELYPQF
jgi:hypothetical protein